MNLKENILKNYLHTAPNCSDSPAVLKVIFSWRCKATAGSTCKGKRKKTLRTRAITESWKRLKKEIFKSKKTGNKKIVREIPKQVGNKGVAHCQFVIPTDAMGMFKAMTGQGNQQVEYHVTAYALGLLDKSATTPPIDHEERKAETKDKIEGKEKAKEGVPPVKRKIPIVTPKQPAKPAVPRAPQSPAEEHRDAKLKRITNLYFTNDKGKFIKEADYNTTIRLNIVSTNLVGSNFKLTVKDKDMTDSDVLLPTKEYTFTGNTTYVDIPLTVEMQQAGGDFGYQNLFVDIVVLATSKHLQTVPINVDLKATTTDPITNVTKFVVEKSDVKKEEKPKLIIFPLLVKPENDEKSKWGKSRNWTAKQGSNMTTFNSNRDNGKRKHAARDLYTNELETVVAIADGIVLEVKAFYASTNQVTVRHTLKDGRDFIIRYGELDPKSVTVKKNDKVTQKQELGKTGKLLKHIKKTGQYIPLMKIDGTTVYMLHFEHFNGSMGFDIEKKSLSNSSSPYNRRSDLIDSLAILQEGYNNSFGEKSTIVEDPNANEFTEHDARLALMKIYDLHGKEMAKTIESIYRWEGKHFKSKQFKICGSPGMEVSGNKPAPNYGWDGSLYILHPEYKPVGLWESMENKGKSGEGGNAQDTVNKKKYIKFPSVEAGMMYIVNFIQRHDGNVGRWHSTDATIQTNYEKEIKTAIPRIVNEF